MINRNLVIAEARSWVGTRFHHQRRLKKTAINRGGVDCLGLLIGVATNLNLTINNKQPIDLDERNYPKIPDGKYFKQILDNNLVQKSLSDLETADILLFKFDKEPQHVGFYVNENNQEKIIHCYMQARGVVEHILDDVWKKRIICAYDIIS